jgi:hypothetical protein
LKLQQGLKGYELQAISNFGKPPVISPDLEERRGILTNTLPALIFHRFQPSSGHQQVSYKNESTHHLYRKLIK